MKNIRMYGVWLMDSERPTTATAVDEQITICFGVYVFVALIFANKIEDGGWQV